MPIRWSRRSRSATAPYIKAVRFSIAPSGPRHPAGDRRCSSAFRSPIRKFGKGVEFFPNVEPDNAVVLVHARGNLSLTEKDRLVREVEQRMLPMKELETVYARAGDMGRGSNDVTEDVIGQIQFSFVDWKLRRPAGEIMADIRKRTADIPGIRVEVQKPNSGPPTGKPIQIQLSSDYPDALTEAAKKVTAELAKRPEIRDLDSGLPMPGIDWRIEVDKAEAAKYGIGVGAIGQAVQLVTNGLKITDYRPSDTDKPVDIILRFPEDRRTLSEIDNLRIETPDGSVPIGNFIKRVPARQRRHHQPRRRIAGRQCDGEPGRRRQRGGGPAGDHQGTAQGRLQGLVNWKLKGSDEEQAKAQAFLVKAFGAALFLIFAVLLAVFNKFSSVLLILSAIILSTIGVFLGAHDHAADLRHRDVGHRHHRAGGRGDEQQHRADRHL